MRRHAELQMAVFAASRSVDVTGASVAMTAALAISTAAALSVFARLQVAHFNFFFLLFAHITFLYLFVWLSVLLVVSGAE